MILTADIVKCSDFLNCNWEIFFECTVESFCHSNVSKKQNV